jgi:type IV secretion system protein VirD4
MPAPPPPLRDEVDAPAGKARSLRDITPHDVPKLGKLKLTDYAAEFKNVQLPKGEKLTGEDLQKVFDSFIREVEVAT